jgi:hypothetical protein
MITGLIAIVIVIDDQKSSDTEYVELSMKSQFKTRALKTVERLGSRSEGEGEEWVRGLGGC